ncbi:rab-type small GTP-binding protein [Suillus discolor]|uniref:Rab-type small GTP-binding protein n=1 Tax=Suillus discolor TaxID=1912936 RepID=A0A9P7JKX0_9AGAM|nr:rab-type small GTP-binding protein [Suillus discolor]KAG2079440.1 rab-type small GTP-binding protein [Suillus discolor]
MPLPHYDFLIKSCLLLHFCDNEINFKVRTIELDGKRIKVQIWDTASQERFRTITTMCYHVATGILLCIRTWHAKIKQRASEDVNVILIGNKSDWTDKRVVPDIQGRALADELGMKFMETSAKAKEGVEEVFFTLTRDCKTRLMDLQADSAVLVGGAPNAGGSVKINQPVTSASIGSCL